ncbi:hypothetical protein ABZP36_031336 [Zizania latifolia]
MKLFCAQNMAHTSFKSKEVNSMFRWSQYLSTEESSLSALESWRAMGVDGPQGSASGQKHLQMEPVVQLSKVAEGLLAKMYWLNSILDYPDPNTHTFSEAFWKASIMPNFPKFCITLSKKFPEHPNKLQLEKVDKFALDALNENSEGYMQNLEQWIMLLLDLLEFREQALRLILDLSSTVITLLPHQNSLILHAFIDLFCSFVRVNLFSDKLPRKMILQVYNILHIMLKGGRDCEFYHRLVQFVDSYDPPVKGMHDDLNFVSPRIGEANLLALITQFISSCTVSTGKEGLVSEGNAAYNWSRCVDELEGQLSKHGSLKKLYFYHQHLTTVSLFRNTMFGPEGRLQHCCAWLGAACCFPECASSIIPEEVNKIGRDSISYVESLIESIMGGLEGLINILDSGGGFGSLEMQLLPEQAAIRLNNATRAKAVSGLLAPGHESYPDNSSSVKMLEAAMQRLTSLCSVLNDMEPICVLNHVFILREAGVDMLGYVVNWSNRDALEGLAGSLNSGDRIERDANLKQIIDIETLADFCIQAGQAITFHRLLVEAVGAVLEEKVPLIYSLLKGLAVQLPDEVPDKNEIIRLRRVTSSVGVGDEHDAEWVQSILSQFGSANDNSWTLLPYLCAAFMVSNMWSCSVYDVNTGGFSYNLHCLARCVSAVVGGNEYTRMEREQRSSLSNGHMDELQEPEFLSRVSAEANIKSAMQLYANLSAGLVLDSWNDTSRAYIVPKLIFLDQLCELSPYLPRSTLEVHIPYTILHSIYHQLYGASLMASESMEPSPRQSPLISLSHSSPSMKQNRVDTTPRSHTFETGYHSSSGSQYDEGYEGDKRREKQLRSMRRSGPLDYTASRKVKFVEGSSSASHGAGSLQRFTVSRSALLSYK